MNTIVNWFRRHVSDPQVVGLTIVLVSITAAVLVLGGMLAPLMAALVIAYLLQGLVNRLERIGLPHIAAVMIVFALFITFLVFTVFGLIPLLTRQTTQLIQQIPSIMTATQRLLMQFPSEYPNLITEAQVSEFVGKLRTDILDYGQRLVSSSVASVVSLITLGVYLILVPLLVFFLMKDRDRIVAWLSGFLPRERQLTNQVWTEVDSQIGNYVRGKVWEIFIVASVSYLVYSLFGVDYAVLLAALTGLSVIIPYVGAAVVFVPVALVGILQWGLTAEFYYLLLAYVVMQALDGNLLAPLLFSEAVNLHPVAIIAAILVFGGIWGFWGVFFAIPLATVIQAVLRAWPKPPRPARASGEPRQQTAEPESAAEPESRPRISA